MKNICFILICLTFLSVLPSYATKVIVNDDKDRIVYSRSSRPPKVLVNEQQTETKKNFDILDENPYDGYQKNSWIRTRSIYDSNYNDSIFPLANDMREELIGIKWNNGTWVYPLPPDAIEKFKSGEYMMSPTEEQQRNRIDENQNIVETTYIEDTRFNRTSREAADYYMVDMVKAPNTLVPSWTAEQ